MNILHYRDSDYEARLGKMLNQSSLFDPVIEERTKAIIAEVAKNNDAALVELTLRFDGAKLHPTSFRVSPKEFAAAKKSVPNALIRTLKFSERNISLFSKQSIRKPWSKRNAQGGLVGEKFDPFQRVGIYVPGGTAPLVSTALMTVVLAKVAGCEEIVVCTPCDKKGNVNPALLMALKLAGATEVYKIGGSQAIAAMALGTRTISKVQKVFGPGNAYVVAAKRLLFGHVAVDLLPGPSELLILADETANPAFVAADLLAQAEHGSGLERVWCITNSSTLLAEVQAEIDLQLTRLLRKDYICKALNNGAWLVQVRSIEDGIALANKLAPEHCELMLKETWKAIGSIRTAGAIFVGPWSPTVLGDYVAGPSHTLPTGGAGLSFHGLTVDQFQRRTSIVQYSKESLKASLAAVKRFGSMEGLDAHSQSAAIRFKLK